MRHLAGDASSRRFYRLTLDDERTLVLVDHGAPFEVEPTDVAIASIFRRAGLPVAAVHDVIPAGALVVEDLGDLTMERAVAERIHPPEAVYARAVELLVRLATRGTDVLETSERASGPALDADRFRFEMDFFVEHWGRGYLGRTDPPAELEPALHELADRAARTPRSVLCHRDFHSRNLMVLSDGSLAMVDVQDARWGPDTYDVASILRDAYLDLDDEHASSWLERFRARLPGPPRRASFLGRYRIVAAQRMIKALGTFGYQMARVGRPDYVEAARRTVRRLRHDLPGDPETAPFDRLLRSAGLLPDLERLP